MATLNDLRGHEQVVRTGLVSEQASLVSPASCVGINLPAVREYMPALWREAGGDRGQLCRAFEQSCAVVSEAQLKAHLDLRRAYCGVDRAFAKSESVTLYRQPRMGRTAYIRASLAGQEYLLDIKGCGVSAGATPRQGYHETGVMSLERAVRELLVSMALQTRYATGPSWQPVRVLAVLCLPISFRLDGRDLYPVILIRTPSVRPFRSDLPRALTGQWEAAIDAEMDLRELGLTTAMAKPMALIESAGQVWTNDEYSVLFSQTDLRRFVNAVGDPLPLRLYKCNVQLNHSIGVPDSWSMIDYEMIRHVQWLPNWKSIALCNDRVLGFGGLLPRVADTPLEGSGISQLLMDLWRPETDLGGYADLIQTWEDKGGARHPRFVTELAKTILRVQADADVEHFTHYFDWLTDKFVKASKGD